jgi:hypothetical protein
MANALTWNPIKVDTAAATALLTSRLHITKIRWVDSGGDIAEGDQAIVKDKAGNPVWEHRAGGVGTVADLVPNVESDFNPPLVVTGLIVSTLTHGTLYIYCDQSKTSIPAAT